MPDVEITTTIKIGKMEANGGSVFVSYLPEHGRIQLYAFDPDDLRKSGILMYLSHSRFNEFKALLGKVDETIEAEAKRRVQHQSLGEGEESVLVTISGLSVSLPVNLYEEAAHLVATGNTMLAASLISKRLSSISLSGAKEVAQAICEQQQAMGIRE